MSFAQTEYDDLIIGSGPNGLACAITLAHAGRKVAVVERAASAGGGTRTAELTLPGFHHDICSAVHPLGVASPFFQSLPLQDHGLKWLYGAAELAHPFDDGSVALLKRSISETAAQFSHEQPRFEKLFGPLALQFDELVKEIMQPMIHKPGDWKLLTRFGFKAMQSAQLFAYLSMRDERARALFMGSAAHSIGSLSSPGSAAVGLVLQLAGLSRGWPIAQGGSGQISRALVSYFKSIGGEVVLSHEVENVDDLPSAAHIFFDLTPQQILEIAGHRLPLSLVPSLKKFRYGPAVFKIDWALNGPIPWKNEACGQAPTVHIGGSSAEIIAAEQAVVDGDQCERPFVLLAQPSLIDPTRAPSGCHTAWAYCHVPNGSELDMTALIEKQVERFAPGFQKVILKRNVMFPRDLEHYNPNYVGGDIAGGAASLKQLLFRPRITLDPYQLQSTRFWICSSSTPPGPGVHGMCGYLAASSALKKLKFKQKEL